MNKASFRLGINYFPARKAMYWWQNFERQEVEADFTLIKKAGFDSVRIFLIWEDFQPTPRKVSDVSLKNLETVANVADAAGLKLIVTFFTGHMSGVNWIPNWAIEESSDAESRFRIFSSGKIRKANIKNWYQEQQILDAQKFLVTEVVSALKNHRSLWAWDLGNESSNCVVPLSKTAAKKWLEQITETIRRIDNHPITIGLHTEDLEEDRNLGPAEAAAFCDFLCMHGYPIYAKCSRNATDSSLLAFLGLLTEWLGEKPVLFEEFGLPTIPHHLDSNLPSLNEAEVARFIYDSLVLLYRFNLIGAMVWCYSDYAQNMWDRPPFDLALHERYFGFWKIKDENCGYMNSSLSEKKSKPAGHDTQLFNTGSLGLEEKLSVMQVRRFLDDMHKLKRFEDRFRWAEMNKRSFYEAPLKNMTDLYTKFLREYNLD